MLQYTPYRSATYSGLAFDAPLDLPQEVTHLCRHLVDGRLVLVLVLVLVRCPWEVPYGVVSSSRAHYPRIILVVALLCLSLFFPRSW